MYEVIKQLFDVCLFKKGPGDLPYSSQLQRYLIIAYAVIRFLMLNIASDWKQSLMRIAVEISYIGGFSGLMLFFMRRPQRFRQVTSAFYGTYALIGFIALPAAASIGIGRGGWVVFIAMIALTGWFCAVTAHIIYHALDRRFSTSIGVAFLFLMGSYLILDVLFPGFFQVD